MSTPSASLRDDARIISLVGLAHGVSHFFHLILAPLFPWIKAEFGLSYAQLGLLMSVFFVVSGVVQAGAGFIVDRYGARPVLFSGIGLLGVSALCLGFSDGYPMLVFGAMLAGAGNGVFHPADFTLLNHKVSAPRLGHAFSVHGISGNLGWAAAPVFLVGIANFGGWRSALFAAAAVAFAVLGLMFSQRATLADDIAQNRAGGKPAEPAPGPAGNAVRESVFAFLRLPRVWVCWGFFFLTTCALAGIQSFAPTALTQIYDMPMALATASYTAYMLSSAAGMALGGFAAARARAHDRLIALCFGVAGVLAWFVASGIAPALLVPALLGCIGFGAGMAGPSRDLLVRAAAPAGATGRVYGIVYSGLDIGFSLAPPVYGALMDASQPALVFVGVGLMQMLAISTAITVGRGNRLRALGRAQAV